MTKPSFFQKIWLFLKPEPGPKAIALQLRHPRGKLGSIVSYKMNESNAALYDFSIDAMEIEDSNILLELGFGNGKFFNKIFSRARKLKIFGIDYSELMVRTARINNATAISEGALKLLYCNCQALPFDSNTFDKIFCINVVYFWENPLENLSEIFRVLKPGGKFYTSIRTKESLLKLPYTQYGFKLYEEEAWKEILLKSHFIFSKCLQFIEPEFEVSEATHQFESMCLIAQKPNP